MNFGKIAVNHNRIVRRPQQIHYRIAVSQIDSLVDFCFEIIY